MRDDEAVACAAPCDLRGSSAGRGRDVQVVKIERENEQIIWPNDFDRELLPLTLRRDELRHGKAREE